MGLSSLALGLAVSSMAYMQRVARMALCRWSETDNITSLQARMYEVEDELRASHEMITRMMVSPAPQRSMPIASFHSCACMKVHAA